MLLIACSICLVLLQEQSISLEVEVGRADRAVAKLAEVSGKALRTSKEVGSEIVFLSVQNRPIQEVMASLARVTSAEWVSEADGTITLTRTQPEKNRILKQDIEKRVAALDGWKAQLSGSLEQDFSPASLQKLMVEMTDLENRATLNLSDSERRANRHRPDAIARP